MIPRTRYPIDSHPTTVIPRPQLLPRITSYVLIPMIKPSKKPSMRKERSTTWCSRGLNLNIKVDFSVLASTTHGRWNKQTNDFLKLCADTKLSNYNTSCAHDPSNDPGSTGAPKWIKQQQVRRWGARLAVALQKGNFDAITSGIVASERRVPKRVIQQRPRQRRRGSADLIDGVSLTWIAVGL